MAEPIINESYENVDLSEHVHLYDVPITSDEGFRKVTFTFSTSSSATNRKRKRTIDDSSCEPPCWVDKDKPSTSSHLPFSLTGSLFDVPITQQIHDTLTLPESRVPTYRNRVLNDQRSLEVSNMGAPTCECPYCGALFWRYEAVKASYRKSIPDFSMCCKKGLINLPQLEEPPTFLFSMLNQDTIFSRNFKQNIRMYNAMFAFTSMGGKIDYEINKKSGPPVFRLCGQNHHIIGSLLPTDNSHPKFSQLYVYDTANEVQNRMSLFPEDKAIKTINQDIVENLIKMFDEHNEIAKTYRMARDRFEENKMLPLKLKLIGRRSTDNTQYEYPTSSEIAGLLVGDFGMYEQNRDIIIEYKTVHAKG